MYSDIVENETRDDLIISDCKKLIEEGRTQWKLLIDNNIKTGAELSQKAEIAPSTISKMRQNKYVSMEVLVKLCRCFNCTFDDIVEIEKD